MKEFLVEDKPDGTIAISASRQKWLGILVLGAFSMLFGVISAVLLPETGWVPATFITMGFTVGFAFGVLAIWFHTRRDLHITVVPGHGLIVRSTNTSSFIPRDMLEGIACIRSVKASSSSSSSRKPIVRYVATALKKDGGVLAMARWSDQAEAEQWSQRIQNTLEDPPKEHTAPDIPLQWRHVTFSRDNNHTTRYTWSARPTPEQFFFVLGVTVPLNLLVYAMWVELGEWWNLGLIGFVGLITALALVSMVLRLGVSHRVTLADNEIKLEKVRGDQPEKLRSFILADVEAVDYIRMFDDLDGSLMIRDKQSQEAFLNIRNLKQKTPQSQPSMSDVLTLLEATRSISKTAIILPVDALSEAERIQLDIALSRDLAERTGREATDL